MDAEHIIPFHKPTLTGGEASYVQEAISSGTWSKISEEAIRFFSEYFDQSPCFFTNSCSSALEMAVKALGIGAGDEVIIPGFSYVALANAVVNNGAKPVFADVTCPGGNLDVKRVADNISQRTRAIIALHYAGSPCDIVALAELCRAHNIYLIEDAAQALGSTYQDKPLGSFGHIGCLSFDYMKNVSCGQGGLLIINDPDLKIKVQSIFDNGTDRYAVLNGTQKYFHWVGKGLNYQMNPIASYFLSAQLRELGSITDDRLGKWDLYHELLSPLVSKNKIIINHPDQGHNGHIFYLIAASEAERSALRGYLRENGIFSEPHYSSLANSPYGRQFTSQNGTLVNSEDLCHRLLRLPIWYGISDSEVEMVASGIESFYAQ